MRPRSENRAHALRLPASPLFTKIGLAPVVDIFPIDVPA
jgi:hypothetical protein